VIPNEDCAMPQHPRRKAGKNANRNAKSQRGSTRQRPLPTADFPARVQAALDRAEPDEISDETLQRVLTAAVKLYAAKMERRGSELKPFRDGAITATETVVAACGMIRAADLNIFDVAMWFHRPMT
jgi:hypothetical protein